jgi:uncharacterized protein (DUF1499 family)
MRREQKKKRRKYYSRCLSVGFLTFAAIMAINSCAYGESIQVMEKFAECPSSPNCVSSYADQNDDKHFIEPYELEYSREESYGIIIDYLNTRLDVEIITEEENNYIHAVFISKIMKFKDDVEFQFSDTSEGSTVVNIRSASRIGYGDFGANRERMEEIREYLNLLPSAF